MKFKVLAGSETFNKLQAIEKKIRESNRLVKAIITELGAEEWLNKGSEYVAGEIGGVRFKEKPDGWKAVYAGIHYNCFMPKSIKQNRPLLDRIAEIPRVKRSEVNDCVCFKRQWVGLMQLSGIGVNWGDTFSLIVISEEAEYTPMPDMEEITVSEYNRLKLQLEEERKEVANADA